MPYPPKRSSERVGHPKGPAIQDSVVIPGTTPGQMGIKPSEFVVPMPPANPDWHPEAQSWYRSLNLSGQRIWFEACDWSMARLAAEILDQIYQGNFNGSVLAQFNDISSRLLCTEGDRRRARVELIKAGAKDLDKNESEVSVAELKRRMKAGMVTGEKGKTA